MRAREIITEIRELPVNRFEPDDYDTGLSGGDLSPNDRKENNQILLGRYKGYLVWTRDLRMQGDTNHEYDIEVTTKRAPYTVVISMELRPYIMYSKQQKLDIDGSKVHMVEKIPAGPGSEINMVDFYIWIMNTLDTAMISDNKQSKGGASIWKRLASDPRANVFAYSPAASEFSQVDDEGDADKWDTWQGSDQEVVDQANSARKSAGYVTLDDAFKKIKLALDTGKMTSEDAIKRMKEVKTIENKIRKEADEARKANTEAIPYMLFAVPSNRSMHS
jgi:hypothetical protein